MCAHTNVFVHIFMCYYLSNPYIATITTCERMQISFMEQECISLSHRLIIRSLYYNYVTKSTFQNSYILLLPSFDAPFVLSMWYTSFSSNFKYDQKTLIHNIYLSNGSKIILPQDRITTISKSNDLWYKMNWCIMCQKVIH